MPTRRWLAAGLVLALLAPARAQEPKPARLEWKFEKDKAFYQTLTTETTRTLKISGKDVTRKDTQTYVLKWTPTKQEDKNWALKLKIEGVRIDSDLPDGGKTSFDSAKPDGASGRLADLYRALTGPDVELTITVNAEMQATDVDGTAKLVEQLGKADPQLEGMLNQVLSRDNLKQIADAAFPALPNKEVKKGDTWSRTSVSSITPLGTFKTTATYTDDGPGKDANVETIGVKAETTYEAPASQGIGFPFKINSATLKSTEGSGTVTFRKDRGRAEKSELKVTLAGKLNMDVSGTATEVEVTQTTTKTVTTSDENPAKK
ncbi:MAG TPA: DUF6263 family protein [Gemmataceae bacterium]|nr:DUF6263 family protein [Gemmataceae bacterium]